MNLSREMHASRIASYGIQFLDNVRVSESGCWHWTGSKAPAGYGRLGRFYAHRLSIQLSGIPLPDDMNALHRCNVPGCVSPDHLYVGTQADNIQQAVREKRMRGQRQTCCQKCGGAYTLGASGRYCRVCNRHGSKRHKCGGCGRTTVSNTNYCRACSKSQYCQRIAS